MFGKNKDLVSEVSAEPVLVRVVSDVPPLSLVNPALVRPEVALLFDKPGNVDDAGYKSLADLVQMFRKAGQQHDVFVAADFDGDLSVNPMHRSYVDRVDQDEALLKAMEAGKKARNDYDNARRAYLDRLAKAREDEIERVAEKIRRNRNAQAQRNQVQSEGGSSEED